MTRPIAPVDRIWLRIAVTFFVCLLPAIVLDWLGHERVGSYATLLALLSGVVAATFLIHLQLTRPLRHISIQMNAFADGQRGRADTHAERLPAEIRDLNDAFERLAQGVVHHEEMLEAAVRQKDMLLLEVHHRVRNNLQLITSIISMQIRQLTGEELRSVLKELQERVMAVATIHRKIYQTSGLVAVSADELLRDISVQFTNLANGVGQRLVGVVDFDEVHLTPDQAVPLALLLAEVLMSLSRHLAEEAALPVTIKLTMKRDETGSITFEAAAASDEHLSTAAILRTPALEGSSARPMPTRSAAGSTKSSRMAWVTCG